MTVTHDPRRRWSYDDYVRIPDDGLRHEIIDGEHLVSPSPNIPHQAAVTDLCYQLTAQIGRTGRGKVLVAPMDVKLTDFDVVQPDVLVVSAEHAARLTGPSVDGPPDLVVEVLSPSTATRDRGQKRSAYERCGVREYWIVDPVRCCVERFVRTVEDRLEADGEFTEELPSQAFPGVVIRLAELWTR